MRIYIIILLLITSSCSSHKKIMADSVRMGTQGEVMFVDQKYNLVLVRFYCVEPPYKRQPCYKDVFFDLGQVGYVTEGMVYNLPLNPIIK
jgi:hypothetical protein